LVLLALLMPQWLVDNVRGGQIRALELAASTDPSLYETVGRWELGVRAVVAWAGVILAGIAWRSSTLRGAYGLIAPPTVTIGVAVAMVSTWLMFFAK
jgi:hypothetical protein